MKITEQNIADVVQRLGDCSYDVSVSLFEAGYLAQVTDPEHQRQFALEAYLEDVINENRHVAVALRPQRGFVVHVSAYERGTSNVIETDVRSKGVYDYLTGNGR